MLSTQRTLLLLSILAMLMSAAWAQELTKQGKNKASAAAATVSGSGTAGRISKWTGVSGSNTYVLGNSNIFEDKFGKVGIGTETPTSLLTVQGMIETTLGGYKFPDGTVQTTAGISSVIHDASLAGNGTTVSPLGIAPGGVQTVHLANGAVTGPKIASGTVVRSLNSLTDNVTVAPGPNITVTQAGNTITVAAPNALATVAHDATLTGEGTVASPLSVVSAEALIEPVASSKFVNIDQCGFGLCTGGASIFTVPTGKLLVIEHVSATCELPVAQPQPRLNKLGISAALTNGTFTDHQLIPVFVNDSVGQPVSVSRFNASQPMRLYSNGNVGVFAERDGISPGGQCVFHMSGHLVTLP